MIKKMPKLFIVGLHKTATTSIKAALEAEGFRVAKCFGASDPSVGKTGLNEALRRIPNYDAFQDDPWYLYYREFHELLPGAKFVLTTRDSDKWYKSALRHFGGDGNHEVRKLFYGSEFADPIDNREHWITRKERHETGVREYFSRFPDVFLEMDITKGDGWEQLGPFIGYNPTWNEFPKVNTALQRKRHEAWVEFSQARGVKRFYLKAKMRVLREFDKVW